MEAKEHLANTDSVVQMLGSRSLRGKKINAEGGLVLLHVTSIKKNMVAHETDKK